MAGLIQQNMAPAAPEQPPMQGAAPDAAMQQDPMAGAAPDGGPPEGSDDPNYVTALKFAMQALYKNGAAKDVATTLTKSRDKVEALANTAYEITAIVDERTEGAVPDELFALLATRILQEVSDIAEAAGIDIKGSDVAMALRTMILRYVGEQGGDTTELQAAMDQVDTSQFDNMPEGETDEEVMA